MQRLGRRRMRASLATGAAIVAVCLVVVATGAWALLAWTGRPVSPHLPAASAGPLPPASIASADGSAGLLTSASVVGTATAGTEIEVPDLVGKEVRVAEALVTAAGLTVQTRVSDPPVPGVQPDAVVSQWPAARALVPAGAQVVITYQPRTSATVAPFVVVIDPGHQQKADLELEPIGPGSKQLKAKVAGGATGVATGLPEYTQALAISLRLRDVLVTKGVKVVMVRTVNAVDIPNSKRAAVGNAAKADLVVRIHLNGSTDNSVAGISTLYPSGNAWVKAIEPPSLRAAQAVQAAVVAATKAHSQGVVGRSDQSGFNYSTRPSILVECGFMSNATEDRLMATPAYQQRLADGIAAGVMAFLGAK